MAKRDISTESMVEVTEQMLAPKARTTLASLPIVSALVPKIEEALGNLISRQVSTPPAAFAAKIAAIQEKQTTLDARHDRKMRGTVNLLGALADIADDPEEAKRYLELRDLLCPDGLKGTIKSYTDESGAAKLLRGRLDEPSKKLLGKIPIPGSKLLDVVNDWTGCAEEIGALEKEKSELLDQNGVPEGRRPADALDARNAWIRVMAALETALDVSGADADTVAGILRPLRDADAKADRKKSAASRAAAAPESAPEEEKKKDPEGNG